MEGGLNARSERRGGRTDRGGETRAGGAARVSGMLEGTTFCACPAPPRFKCVRGHVMTQAGSAVSEKILYLATKQFEPYHWKTF